MWDVLLISLNIVVAVFFSQNILLTENISAHEAQGDQCYFHVSPPSRLEVSCLPLGQLT